jgi:hypothetical protein
MEVTCWDCKRPLRPSHKTEDDMPGTLRHCGKGYCGACYTRRKRAGTIPESPSRIGKRIFAAAPGTIECEGHGCARILRPHGARAEDWPGTYARKARNRCSTCYELAFREVAAEPDAVARTADSLASYLAWRRPHRLKAGTSC